MRRHTGVWAALVRTAAAAVLISVAVPAVPAVADPTSGTTTPTTTDTTTPPATPPTTPPTTTAPAPPAPPAPSPTATSTSSPTGSSTPPSSGVPATFLGQLDELRTQATTLQADLLTAQTASSLAIATYTATTQQVQAALDTAQQAQQDLVSATADVDVARKQVQLLARDAFIERTPHTSSALLLTSNGSDLGFAVAVLGYLSNRGDDVYARLATARSRASALSDQQQTALADAQKLQTTATAQQAAALAALTAVQTKQATFLLSVVTLRDTAAKAAASTALSPADQAAYQAFLAELNALGAGATTLPSGTTYVAGGPGLTPLPGTSWVKPLAGGYTISSCYCARWGTFHHGVDLAAPSGTPIYAVGAGTVVAAGPANGFGNWVVIDHHDGSFSIYGHMRVLATVVGTQVTAGTLIAYVGDEGESTGFHLHFEVRLGSYANATDSTDPTLWLAQRGVTL